MTATGKDLAARRPRSRAAALLRTAVLPLAVLLLVAATLPSEVVPAEVEGDRVALEPAVVRAPEGTAAVDLALGSAATDDVVVAFSLLAATADAAGTVAPGGPVPGATVTRGARVRPGERLRATVTTDVPTLLVAEVVPVGGDPAATTSLSALVLPGAAGPPPQLTLAADGEAVTGRVETTSALLVSVRFDAATSTVLADRLVLPDQPLQLSDDPPAWLRPTELVVSDELDRTVRATRGAGGLIVLAVGLVVLALGTVLLVRRRS